MDIADVARRTKVPASTLRYYEKRGLIASASPPGVRRQFAPQVLQRLALIALGQAAGLSLDEIGSMLAPSGGPAIDRRLLAAKADEIDANVRQLRAVSRGLRHAAACRAPSHAECPTFQRLLQAAASGALARRQYLVPREEPSPTPAPGSTAAGAPPRTAPARPTAALRARTSRTAT